MREHDNAPSGSKSNGKLSFLNFSKIVDPVIGIFFSSEAFYVLRSDRFLLLLLGASRVNGEKAGHQVLFPASEAVDSGQIE